MLQEIATDAEEGEDSDLEDIAHRLAAFAGDGEDGEETLQVPVEETPRKEDPSPAPGFGGRGYSGSGIIVLGVLATLFVVAMAALSVWILSQVGNEKTSPVVTKSESTTETTFPNVPPVLFKDVKTTSSQKARRYPAPGPRRKQTPASCSALINPRNFTRFRCNRASPPARSMRFMASIPRTSIPRTLKPRR